MCGRFVSFVVFSCGNCGASLIVSQPILRRTYWDDVASHIGTTFFFPSKIVPSPSLASIMQTEGTSNEPRPHCKSKSILAFAHTITMYACMYARCNTYNLLFSKKMKRRHTQPNSTVPQNRRATATAHLLHKIAAEESGWGLWPWLIRLRLCSWLCQWYTQLPWLRLCKVCVWRVYETGGKRPTIWKKACERKQTVSFCASSCWMNAWNHVTFLPSLLACFHPDEKEG